LGPISSRLNYFSGFLIIIALIKQRHTHGLLKGVFSEAYRGREVHDGLEEIREIKKYFILKKFDPSGPCNFLAPKKNLADRWVQGGLGRGEEGQKLTQKIISLFPWLPILGRFLTVLPSCCCYW
jgi:hypothetical protein